MANMMQLQGYDEFVKKLKQVPDRIKKQEINKVQRSLLRPVKNKAQAIAKQGPGGKNPGSLSKAIGYYTIKAKQVAGITLGVQRSAKRKYKAYHWHLFAFGTRRRQIKTPGGIQVKLGNNVVTVTQTGTMPANPYMEQAMQSNGQQLAPRHAKSVLRIMQKAIKQ